jgi:basic membrane protein A and related proteins
MTRKLEARWRIGLVGIFAAALLTSSANAQQLKIGILLPGSTADNGYNADGARAAQALKSQLNADVQTTENVSVANQADLYRQYAAKGYNVVIGWGGQFTDGAVQVAQEFPDVKFIVVNSGVENGKNLASIDTDIQDWEFLGGFVTAKLSKTGVIGWVGGQCFPATAANLHGVEQGAKYADANIKVLSTFTGDFEDPTKAQQAAQAMIDSGKAGALTGNLNNGWFGVLKAARDNGKIPVVTEWVDNHAQAPDVIASSIQKSQAKFVVAVVKEISPGKFQGKHYQFGITPDWGDVMTKTNLLPDALFKEVAGLQAKITSGEIKPKNVADCPK